MEVTAHGAGEMITAFDDEVREAGLQGDDLRRETSARLPGLHRVGEPVYRNWAGLAAGR